MVSKSNLSLALRLFLVVFLLLNDVHAQTTAPGGEGEGEGEGAEEGGGQGGQEGRKSQFDIQHREKYAVNQERSHL